MKILHILNDGAAILPDEIILAQSKGNEVKVVNLSKKEVSYDKLVDDIFSYDKVISW